MEQVPALFNLKDLGVQFELLQADAAILLAQRICGLHFLCQLHFSEFVGDDSIEFLVDLHQCHAGVAAVHGRLPGQNIHLWVEDILDEKQPQQLSSGCFFVEVSQVYEITVIQ